MNEQAILFGGANSLVGIITEPQGGTDRGHKPNVILLNAGLLHRIGPNRTYVKLIRRLAGLGYTGLRFDLSGIGDSRAATDGHSEPDSRLRDIRDAMDMMAAKTGEDRFILGGLCDGAVSSFAAAAHDPRVVGVVLIDAFRYKTRGYYLRRYRDRFFRARSWLNLLTGEHPLTRWIRRDRESSESDDRPMDSMPPPAEIEVYYKKLLQRGMQSLEIYPGDGSFNDARQFAEMFPEIANNDQIRLEYLADTNHTFVLLRHQKMLFECVERWITETEWPAYIPDS